MSDSKPRLFVDGAPRLDLALVEAKLVPSRRKASHAIGSGKVDMNGQTILLAGTRVPPGATVRIDWNRRGTSAKHVAARTLLTAKKIVVVFEDTDLLVLAKPPGMLTDTATQAQQRAADSLRHWLERYLRPQGVAPVVVHRIDRDTSGLVAFSKSEEMGDRVKAQFARRSAERVYWCAVQGRPGQDSGEFVHWMAWDVEQRIQRHVQQGAAGAVRASADWRVLQRQGAITALEVRLHSGRRNQIRLHCQLHAMPLVGERQYLPRGHRSALTRLDRQALHAWRLGFLHPRTEQPLQFESPVPPELLGLLAERSTRPQRSPQRQQQRQLQPTRASSKSGRKLEKKPRSRPGRKAKRRGGS